MKFALLVLALLAGISIALQTAVNSALRARLHDPMHATLVSFVVGTLVAILYCAVVRSPLPDRTIWDGPWWMWTGGLLGIVFVWSTVVIAPQIGGAMFLSLVIAGQLLMALLIDHFGWLQMEAIRTNPIRILGVALVVVGATVVAWSK
jgi:transporter family-2 protein